MKLLNKNIISKKRPYIIIIFIVQSKVAASVRGSNSKKIGFKMWVWITDFRVYPHPKNSNSHLKLVFFGFEPLAPITLLKFKFRIKVSRFF